MMSCVNEFQALIPFEVLKLKFLLFKHFGGILPFTNCKNLNFCYRRLELNDLLNLVPVLSVSSPFLDS